MPGADEFRELVHPYFYHAASSALHTVPHDLHDNIQGALVFFSSSPPYRLHPQKQREKQYMKLVRAQHLRTIFTKPAGQLSLGMKLHHRFISLLLETDHPLPHKREVPNDGYDCNECALVSWMGPMLMSCCVLFRRRQSKARASRQCKGP